MVSRRDELRRMSAEDFFEDYKRYLNEVPKGQDNVECYLAEFEHQEGSILNSTKNKLLKMVMREGIRNGYQDRLL